MIKSIGKLTLATILAALVVGVPMGVSAQEKTAPAPAAPASPEAKTKSGPFHGKLSAVDKVKKTITLEGKSKRTFEITSETKLTKNSKPATLDDAVIGEDVGGYYTKSADGKMVAKSIRFGAKAEAKAATKEAAPAK